jgi:hypothetical protein
MPRRNRVNNRKVRQWLAMEMVNPCNFLFIHWAGAGSLEKAAWRQAWGVGEPLSVFYQTGRSNPA